MFDKLMLSALYIFTSGFVQSQKLYKGKTYQKLALLKIAMAAASRVKIGVNIRHCKMEFLNLDFIPGKTKTLPPTNLYELVLRQVFAEYTIRDVNPHLICGTRPEFVSVSTCLYRHYSQ